MLKKLQALKAKKGFTLVELIVVIAIIGVLAAILVPTLMGQVTKSRVTSLDQTAASLKDTVGTWMVDCDANAIKIPNAASVTITGTSTGKSTTTSFFSNPFSVTAFASTTTADGALTGLNTGVTVDITDATGYDATAKSKALKKLATLIDENYNFSNKTISAKIFIVDRKVYASVYSDIANVQNWTAAAFDKGTIKWGSKTDGKTGSGDLIGTSPKLQGDETNGAALPGAATT